MRTNMINRTKNQWRNILFSYVAIFLLIMAVIISRTETLIFVYMVGPKTL